ncbi:helix-turn-helix domain-containing protein [Nocardia nova]|uniref:helix-turn-helix domain-containing protein n=1 Tax=Nocardia nova TaxID=37330 RepID=UPI0004B3494C|nr:helix-turn-helix domain-containing protein [Nocardia nova]
MSDRAPAPYLERPARTCADAVVWRRRVGAGPVTVLPDGCMDLLWLGGRLVVAGPDTRAQHSAAVPETAVHGIRFAPGTAPALLGVVAPELLDQRVELAQLWPARRVRHLADLVAAAPDPAAGLEEIARRCAEAAGPPDPVLAQIVRRLDAGAPVAATADALGLGARRLHRISVSAFGYGPKMLARVLRMRRALDLARSDIGFADAAALAGYADQAHMTRDIRALTGRSPGRVIGSPRAAQPSGA